MALVALSKIRLHLGFRGDISHEDDDLLTSLEEQATGMMASLSGWDLDTASESTEYYNGTGTNVLVLRGVPDTDETFTLSERSGDTWTALDSGDYTVIVEGGGARAKVLRLDQGFAIGELNYKVLSTMGYSTTTCPALLQRAIVDLVALWYRARKVSRPTASQDGEAASEPDALGLASVKAWLQASKSKQEAVLLAPLARM